MRASDGRFPADRAVYGLEYHNAWLERASHTIFDGNYFGTPAFNPRAGSILGPATGTPA
jgi:hypothetical protein